LRNVLGSLIPRWSCCWIILVGSRDYERSRDPTCALFEPVLCNLFVSEATFGLLVFSFSDASDEITKPLKSVELVPERTYLVGAYALGKAQRIICMLRELDTAVRNGRLCNSPSVINVRA
jgi:putative mRNA 3-end processing factor